MEDIMIIITGILVVLMLLVIALYNRMDRLRFRLDRLMHHASDALDDWADICHELHPGSADAYRKARKNWEKLACLQQMVSVVTENNEEKLNIQEQLLDFCSQLRQLADRYNDTLDGSILGGFYRMLGFLRYTPLDFYPYIQLPTDKTDK